MFECVYARAYTCVYVGGSTRTAAELVNSAWTDITLIHDAVYAITSP